jgi:hypothetical protein
VPGSEKSMPVLLSSVCTRLTIASSLLSANMDASPGGNPIPASELPGYVQMGRHCPVCLAKTHPR